MSGSLSISNDGGMNTERIFTDSARKIPTGDRSENTQKAPADSVDRITISGGMLFKVDQVIKNAEVDQKLPPPQQDSYRSPLNVMV
jgi:hypothetical protein